MTGLAIIVHALHVLAGIAWVGGYALVAFAVWPALLGRDLVPSRATFTALGARVGQYMAVAGSATFVLGLVRAAGWTTLRSPRELATTAYGITLSVAFVLTLVTMIHGARAGRTLEARMWDGETLRPGARALLVRSAAFSLSCFAAIVVCMVLMHFGL